MIAKPLIAVTLYRDVLAKIGDVVPIDDVTGDYVAFLGVGGARRIEAGPLLTEENRHELVHAGVGEKEIRRVRQEGR